MAQYDGCLDDVDFPPIPWNTVIRWGAVAIVLLLPVLTCWCLSRPFAWAVERW